TFYAPHHLPPPGERDGHARSAKGSLCRKNEGTRGTRGREGWCPSPPSVLQHERDRMTHATRDHLTGAARLLARSLRLTARPSPRTPQSHSRAIGQQHTHFVRTLGAPMHRLLHPLP